MEERFDANKLSEGQRLAYYGALFAMSGADEHIDREEVELIYGALDLDGLSETTKRTLHSYVITPPSLEAALEAFASADQTVRFGALLGIAEIAYADGVLEPGEHEALELARTRLGASEEQLEAILKFVQTAKAVRDRGLDDKIAADMLKNAVSGLGAVGIPLGIVYFSGAVIGLSAAGITSGLAALGLGLGMVPGIGVAILLGTAIYFAGSTLLDTGNKRKRRKTSADRERRVQLVIKNLQASIQHLAERVAELAEKAAESDANRESIRQLSARIRSLRQLLEQRQQTAAG